MNLSGALYIGAIIVFILTGILLLADSVDGIEGLALVAFGLAALAAAGGPWAVRRL